MRRHVFSPFAPRPAVVSDDPGALHPGAPDQDARYHGFDALRAVAMFLGLWLHAGLIHTEYLPPDQPRSDALTVSVVFVHAFRMQAFFLLAGFFANMLVARRGWLGFAKNRAMRVALPLVAGGLTVVPIMGQLWPLADRRGVWAWFPSWYHLWFLQYLLFMYAGAFVLVPACRALGVGRWRPAASGLLASRGRALVLALLVTVFMLGLPGLDGGGGGADERFWPTPASLAYYSCFFAVGWVLYACRDAIGGLSREGREARGFSRHWRWIAALASGGLVAFPIALGYVRRMSELTPGELLVGKFWYSLVTAAMIWGLIELFLVVCRRPSRFWRYVSDASYWVYLLHLPVVVLVSRAMEAPLGGVVISPVYRFALVLAVSTPLLLASYHVFVRRTVIGRVLRGRWLAREPDRTPDREAGRRAR